MDPSEARLLIIEEHEEARRLLHDIFMCRGYEVEVTPNGVEACRRFERGPCEVAVTNDAMPRKENLQLFETIRRTSPEISVSLLGELDDPAAAGAECGFYACLPNPFDLPHHGRNGMDCRTGKSKLARLNRRPDSELFRRARRHRLESGGL